MIYVTLGTQDKSFKRLLESIDKEIKNGNIKDKVIVQAGCTKYDTKNMELFDLIDKDDFEKYMAECDLLITHGGIGSIISGLKNGKKVIACPRLAKYNEHINDHQLQIVERFAESGYILAYYENDNLKDILEKVKKFKPNKYKSNTKNIIKLITDYIDKN